MPEGSCCFAGREILPPLPSYPLRTVSGREDRNTFKIILKHVTPLTSAQWVWALLAPECAGPHLVLPVPSGHLVLSTKESTQDHDNFEFKNFLPPILLGEYKGLQLVSCRMQQTDPDSTPLTIQGIVYSLTPLDDYYPSRSRLLASFLWSHAIF